MTTAGAVATELRRLADALDKEPEAVIEHTTLYFSHSYVTNAKERFITLARLLPRPLTKNYMDPNWVSGKGDLELKYYSPALRINAYIPRSEVCTLVEPAKPAVYKCELLLSDEEESALTQEGSNVIR